MMDVNKLIQNNQIAVMRRNIEENITNNINEIIKCVVDKAFNEGYQCGKDDAYAELNPSDVVIDKIWERREEEMKEMLRILIQLIERIETL